MGQQNDEKIVESAPVALSVASGETEEKTKEVQKERPPWNVWAILFISSFGVFMASVSTSALIIAFPVLLMDLKMNINTMMWVLLVLLVVIGAVVPTAGKLGDILGQANIYKIGYWFFVIGSLGAGFVSVDRKGYDLVAARIIIGFGAALLFTNSSAILTNAFAPYNLVGLSQGIFQLSAAMGIVFGPLIGGGFAESNWRWIFWFNVPPGGLCAIAATIILKDKPSDSSDGSLSTWDHLRRFDFVGALGCSFGLILILLAMIQGVVADPILSRSGPLAGIIIAGCVCGTTFICAQFFAVDPLIPPSIFYNRTYAITTACATLMAFARNSITYNMIFFLQGPYGMDPLAAGINLIPFGIGIMVAGFSAGAAADRFGIRPMTVFGSLLVLTGCACLAVMDNNTTNAYVSGILFLTGFGVGLFQSPNSTANMLSVAPNRRGVAAAIGMLTMTFSMMVGIVITFGFVLNSMSAEQLFALFIFGAQAGSVNVRACLDALAMDYYIVIAACLATSILSYFHDPNLMTILKTPPSLPTSKTEDESKESDKAHDVESGAGIEVTDTSDQGNETHKAAGAYQELSVTEDPNTIN